MPSWSAYNSVISTETLPESVVGFLPLLPYPVTQYDTVYTSLANFQDVLNQLQQEKIAIICDEGVYKIAREILLWRPDEFSDIVLCLGNFHLIK